MTKIALKILPGRWGETTPKKSGLACHESRGSCARKSVKVHYLWKGKGLLCHTTPHFMECFWGTSFAATMGVGLVESVFKKRAIP